MLVVRVEEPMRVAPDGHVIDLKAGETAEGSLAEYLVASGCNVTAVEADEAAGDEEPQGSGGGDLTASLTATAAVAQKPKPEPAAKPVKAAKG